MWALQNAVLLSLSIYNISHTGIVIDLALGDIFSRFRNISELEGSRLPFS